MILFSNPLAEAYEVLLAVFANLPPVFISFISLWLLLFLLFNLFNIIFKLRS